MNDDDLKKLWQQQPLRVPDISAAQLVSAMQSKTSQLRRIVDARDLREVLASAFVIIIFGIFYFTIYNNPISRVGDLIVIGGAIFIAWKLVYTRRSHPPAPPGAATVESLRAELNSVRAQSRLLGSVLWWYLLPLAIGELIATWGLQIDLFSKSFGALIFIAVNAFIYRLNQRARAKQLLPVEAQLESLLHSAETGEPLDATQAASLRPIVVSMAAAGHVKPAEFKVAFWQIAIPGVAGFVGIWFFLMIGLGVYHENWKPKEPAVQSNPAAETNRYFVVVQKAVELFNAGDYAAMQKLYNPGMAQAFPPQKNSAFYTDLATRCGKIESFDGPTTNGYHGWTAFWLHCQHDELVMSLALDANGKIAGIYFQPAWLYLDIKLFIARSFNWPHMVLLVPFFLAGLLYSRMLQKLTERAVGISTLGIHLHKGRNLVLWDEIKEVRLLRILNIHSLWLIKESGEKTIMPWSSLDRHSDLKAAVEAFAPANHPIRKHLSLLKRTSR